MWSYVTIILLIILGMKCYQYRNVIALVINQHPLSTLEMLVVYLGGNIHSNSPVKSDNSYKLYYENGKYCVCFPRTREMRHIVHVKDENGEDVTDDVLKYLGQAHNFHGIPTTPNMLGYGSLKVKYRSGGKSKYNSNTPIELRHYYNAF